MHVLLIYLSVIMISRFVESLQEGDIQDLSEWCVHGRILYFYLTTGIGSSDNSVGMLANESLNCTVIYSAKAKKQVMVVLEFLDLQSYQSVCITEQNTSVTVSDFKKKRKCYFSDTSLIYSKMAHEKVSLHFKQAELSGTIKIIATTMRDSQSLSCSTLNEIECWVDGKVYCMTHSVACDGHNNCGVADSFDEDVRVCEEKGLTILMILASTVMVIVSLFLFTSLWMVFLPKRKEIFVYKFDHRMPLFDSEGGIINAEIEIVILFPNEKKNQDK